MAFQEEPTRAATSLPTVEVILRDELPDHQSAEFRVLICYSDETERERRGDLVPHITAEQRATLMAFMDDIRAQAETEILP